MSNENLRQFPSYLFAALIFIVVVVVTWPCLLLDRPFESDHAVHLAKTIFLEKSLLAGHGFYSWEHHWFAGYPMNLNYPFAGYLITIFLRWFSFSLLSWDASYALTILLTFLIYAWGVYLLARQAMPRHSAAIASCFSLLDGGGYLMGGYIWEVKFGVWPCKLAVALCLIGYAFYLEAFRQESSRGYLKAALVTVASLVSHPISLLFWCLVAPLTGLYIILNETFGGKTFQIKRRYLFISTSLVVFASLFWVGPFLLGSGLADNLGGSWDSFSKVYEAFISFRLFRNISPLISFSLVFGAFYSLLLTTGLNRFFAALGLFTIVVITREVSSFFLAALPVTVGQNVQLVRMLMIAKPFLFIAAAGSVNVAIFYFSRALFKFLDSSLLAIVLILGTLSSGIWYWPSMRRKPEWNTVWLSTNPTAKDLALVRDWVCQQKFSENNFYRIGFLVEKYFYRGSPPTHGLYNINHVCDVPLFKLGFTPAISFKYLYDNTPFSELNRFAIKYLLADKEQNSSELKFLKRVGDQFVYEVNSFRGPSTVVKGYAQVELKRWSDELIEYEIFNSKDATIEIPLVDIGYWRVSQNSLNIPTLNSAVSLERVRHRGRAPFLVQVPVKDGKLRLEYQPSKSILILSCFGLFVWLGMIGTYLFRSSLWKKIAESISLTQSDNK